MNSSPHDGLAGNTGDERTMDEHTSYLKIMLLMPFDGRWQEGQRVPVTFKAELLHDGKQIAAFAEGSASISVVGGVDGDPIAHVDALLGDVCRRYSGIAALMTSDPDMDWEAHMFNPCHYVRE